MSSKQGYDGYASAASKSINDSSELANEVEAASKQLISAIKEKAVFLIGGNGGSAAMADHMTGELIGRFNKERKPLPAMCINCGTSAITCISNDYGYEDVFVRQLAEIGRAHV